MEGIISAAVCWSSNFAVSGICICEAHFNSFIMAVYIFILMKPIISLALCTVSIHWGENWRDCTFLSSTQLSYSNFPFLLSNKKYNIYKLKELSHLHSSTHILEVCLSSSETTVSSFHILNKLNDEVIKSNVDIIFVNYEHYRFNNRILRSITLSLNQLY